MDPNQPDEQGKVTLEKILSSWIDHAYFLNHTNTFQALVKTAIENGAKMDTHQAGLLLQKVLEKILDNSWDPITYADIVNFLEQQQPQLDSSQATELWKKLIQKTIDQPRPRFGGPEIDFSPVLDLLQKQGVNLSAHEATDLLRQAGNKTKTDLYSRLINIGADPNIEITRSGKKTPLLKYAFYEDPTLLQQLIDYPKTEVNKIGEDNHTLAMQTAFYPSLPNLELLSKLLKRDDLNINTIPSQETTTKDYTLLDLLVRACSLQASGGHREQIEAAVKQSEKAYQILKDQVYKHPKFSVTQENIDRAQQNLNFISSHSSDYGSNKDLYTRHHTTAENALKLLKTK